MGFIRASVTNAVPDETQEVRVLRPTSECINFFAQQLNKERVMAINLQRLLIEKGKRVAYRISKRQVSVVPPAVNFVGKQVKPDRSQLCV